jgi:hypothetical protein
MKPSPERQNQLHKGTSKNSRKWKIQNERSRLSAPDFPKI